MDAREHGSKVGSAGPASSQNEAIDRRERLRKLALETIDLAKDPYFMRNHLGRCVMEQQRSPSTRPHALLCFSVTLLVCSCVKLF